MEHHVTDPALRALHVAERIEDQERGCTGLPLAFENDFFVNFPEVLNEMHDGLPELNSRPIIRRRNKEFRRYWAHVRYSQPRYSRKQNWS